MKNFFCACLLVLSITHSENLFATSTSAGSSRLWSGGGIFSVVYDHATYSQDCSFVTVQVVETNERVQLSTRYNCQDDEDQEFVPLTLDRQGKDLFYGKDLVGHIDDHAMSLKFIVGRQIERYSLRFENTVLHFWHSSDLGTPGLGILEAELTQK
jgi:hypothetical protein